MPGSSLWLSLPALVTAFLFQPRGTGWCPPVPLLRRPHVRAAREIELERIALEALRGDFDGIHDASSALKAAAREVHPVRACRTATRRA